MTDDPILQKQRAEAALSKLQHNYAWGLIYSHQAFVAAGIERDLTLPGIDPVVVELVKEYKDYPLGKCTVCGCNAALSHLEKMDNRMGLMSCAWGCDDDSSDMDDENGDGNIEGGGTEAEGLGGHSQ